MKSYFNFDYEIMMIDTLILTGMVMIVIMIKNMMMLMMRRRLLFLPIHHSTPCPPPWYELFHGHDFEYDVPDIKIIIIDISLNDDPDIDDQKVYLSNTSSLIYHLNSQKCFGEIGMIMQNEHGITCQTLLTSLSF